MYASRPKRNADIDAGAGLSPAELVADVETTAAALAPRPPASGPSTTTTRSSARPVSCGAPAPTSS